MRGSRVAEANSREPLFPWFAAHAWPKPTVVSRYHHGSVATRVAEANNRAANNLPLLNFKLNESVSQ